MPMPVLISSTSIVSASQKRQNCCIAQGGIYQERADYAQAEAFLKRALSLRESILGPEYPDVANTLDLMGQLHRSQGQYVEAEAFYQRALSNRERTLGPAHPDTAD